MESPIERQGTLRFVLLCEHSWSCGHVSESSFHKDTSERVRVQKQGARGDFVAIVVPGKNTERQICQLPKSDLAQRYCAGELDAGSMYRARDALLLPKMPKKRTSEAAEDALPTKRPRVETVESTASEVACAAGSGNGARFESRGDDQER